MGNRVSRALWLCAWFLSVLPAVTGAAEVDCPEVRLDHPGGSFAEIPVYDQKKYSKTDAGICYAITVSAQIDDYRRRHGETLDKLTSPLSLAVNFKRFQQKNPALAPDGINDPDGIGGGNMKATLEASQSRPVCDQRSLEKFASVVASSRRKIRPGQESAANGKSIGSFLNAVIDQIHAYENSQRAVGQATRRLGTARAGTISPLNDYFSCRVLEEATSADEILKIAKISADPETKMAAAQKFLDGLCRDHALTYKTPALQQFTGYPADPTAAQFQYASDLQKYQNDPAKRAELKSHYSENYGADKRVNRVREKMNEVLVRAKIPVGIEYCGNIFKGTDGCDPHASVVIGQRRNPESGSCELSVRNSFGRACVDQRHEPLYNYECENGNIWIRADALIKKTSTLSWIP